MIDAGFNRHGIFSFSINSVMTVKGNLEGDTCDI